MMHVKLIKKGKNENNKGKMRNLLKKMSKYRMLVQRKILKVSL